MTIYHSAFADIDIPAVSITDYIIPALISRRDMPVLIDGPTGRALTGAMLLDLIRRLAGGLKKTIFYKNIDVSKCNTLLKKFKSFFLIKCFLMKRIVLFELMFQPFLFMSI